jgi:hypothetical protein
MNEQDRLKEGQRLLEVLKQTCGVEIVAVIQAEQLNSSFIQTRALPILQLVPGWQALQAKTDSSAGEARP